MWIIDPLDGTNEFGERGRSDWAVHVALVTAGRPTAAAVALPALGFTFATDPPPSSTRAGGAAALESSQAVRVRRTPRSSSRAALGADVVRLGSAGAKTMAVVMGDADIYAHAGGMYEWDSPRPRRWRRRPACTSAASTARPLVYNRPDPWLPDLLVCRPELAAPVLEALWG